MARTYQRGGLRILGARMNMTSLSKDLEKGKGPKRPYCAPKLTKHGDVQTITGQAKTFGFNDLAGQQHVSPPGSS